MSGKSPLMTKAEEQCFKAARKLQRRDVLDRLRNALLPTLPLLREAMQHSASTRFVYFSLMLVGLPLILVFWLVRLAFTLILFPYRYFSTYFLPPGFKPPGERNIQGMHSAWSRYLNLSTRRYVKCINVWAKILYGKERAKEYALEKYFDTTLLEQSDVGGQAAYHLRSSLRAAREQVSKKLGYY